MRLRRGFPGLRYPAALVPPPELGLGVPGGLRVAGVRLGPFPAGRVGDGEPGQVLARRSRPRRLGFGGGLRVHAVPGDLGPVLRGLQVPFALADLGLDIARGQAAARSCAATLASSSPRPMARSRA